MDFITTLIYSNKVSIRILRHVLFWLTDILSYLSVISISREINATEVMGILLRLTPIILTTYFILYYIIPHFSRLNDKGKLLLWILAILLVVGVGMRGYIFYLVNPILGIPRLPGIEVWDFRIVISQVFTHMAVICMAVTIKLVKNKTDLQETNQQLQAEKKLAELNFLKAQMQPHFLFNTLNTLYSETIQESGKAQQIVLHLSNLLRFILDECNKTLIPVGHEVKVIKDFVALEQLRHGSRLDVNVQVKELDHSAMISPLVFLPFVENSFKHTLRNQRGTIHIDIEIGMVNGSFYLIVQNDSTNTMVKLNGRAPGKGIFNVRKQLDLLYGKEYFLTINEANEKYRVSLTIPTRTALLHV